ncbi:DUF2269 domain-containing protein [Streptomyces sp. P1-3]|uniref:DUF2269 domain-containing protein n=1 Tax=Streptomyces sp. P1-3 TaxID=3421658 RepID=UPI003D364331
MQLKRPVRRSLLVAHVAVSVGWLGLSLCLLALGVAGATTRSPQTAAAAYRAMRIFADWLLLPIAGLTLASGLVLALGTPWGLARHRWVWAKFWLTLAAAAASAFALRPEIDAAADEVDRLAAGEAVTGVADLVIAPSVATAVYVFITAVSVLKPWGPTRRGRRLRSAGARRSATRPKTAS